MSDSRLTTLDASFLEVESASAHMHVGWAARFASPRERSAPDFAQLRDHVADHLGRAPRYRQKLAQVPLDLNDPVWVDDEDFDIDRHVRHSRSGSLEALADEVLSEQLARDRPLWELWITDNLPDGGIGVVGKAHHAMADGIAAVELATLLLDPTPEPPPPTDDGWRPQPPPGGTALVVDGLIDRARTTLGLAARSLAAARDPRSLFGFAGDGLRSALALADSLRPADTATGLNEPISARRHLARSRHPLDDLRRVKTEFGATINDVVLAVASGGVRRFLHRRGEEPVPLKAMVPVSVREEDGAGALGNQISFVFVDLPCDEPDPVARLNDVKNEVGQRKRSGRPQGASQALKAFAYTPRLIQRALARVAASPSTFNFVVSNIPGPREPLYMLGCELEEVYPVVPIADGHAFSIGFTTVRDDAFFGIYADEETLPDADDLAECLDEALEELLALGDVTDERAPDDLLAVGGGSGDG